MQRITITLDDDLLDTLDSLSQRRGYHNRSEAIRDLIRGRLPTSAYPTAVRVVVNPTVAQTLGVSAAALDRLPSSMLRP